MVFFTGIYQQINYQRNNQVRQPTAKLASEVGANQTSSRRLSFSSKSSSQPIRLTAGHRLGPHENIMVLWTSQSSITSLDSSWLFLHHKARDSNIVNVTTHEFRKTLSNRGSNPRPLLERLLCQSTGPPRLDEVICLASSK